MLESWVRVISVSAIIAMSVSAVQATNLVINGDFSLGNSGFASGHTYVAPAAGAMGPPSVYTITPNMRSPIDLHSSAASYFDHTEGDATGEFMAVNGSTAPGVVVWEQFIPVVTPGTNYYFSTWISSWVSGAPASLQFSINGVLIGPAFSAPLATGVWDVFETNWNSGASASATISIINSTIAFGGNDYALDDIVLSTTSVVVPEPGYFAGIGVALTAIVCLRRRKG
jgi:hypothetical protein